MISVSSARGSPTVDQWTDSMICAAKVAAQSGDKFMSIKIFMQRQAVLRFLPRATLRKPELRANLLPQDTDMLSKYR